MGLERVAEELLDAGARFLIYISVILTYSTFGISSKDHCYFDEAPSRANDITCGDVGLVSEIRPARTPPGSALRRS